MVVIILKTNFFVLIWRDINFVFNVTIQLIQLINTFLFSLHFVNINCLLNVVVVLLVYVFNVTLLYSEISKNQPIYTYVSSLWPNWNIYILTQPTAMEIFQDT